MKAGAALIVQFLFFLRRNLRIRKNVFLQKFIINDEPFVGVLKWSLLKGHMVAVTGFDEKEKRIKLVDPWEDTPNTLVPYNEAINEYQFHTGLGKYSDSILANKNN